MPAHASIRSAAAIGAAVGLLVAASQAQAHARLVSATPAANATVGAPKTITLRFSEAVVPKFSGADLMKSDGALLPVTSSVPADDHKTVTLTPKGVLAPGSYMVMWHAAAADDGHRTKGDFSFIVK